MKPGSKHKQSYIVLYKMWIHTEANAQNQDSSCLYLACNKIVRTTGNRFCQSKLKWLLTVSWILSNNAFRWGICAKIWFMLESWFMELADCCQKGYRYQSLTLIIIYMLACIKSEVDSFRNYCIQKVMSQFCQNFFMDCQTRSARHRLDILIHYTYRQDILYIATMSVLI